MGGREKEGERKKKGRWERENLISRLRDSKPDIQGGQKLAIKRPLQATEDSCFKNYPQGTVGGARVVFTNSDYNSQKPLGIL